MARKGKKTADDGYLPASITVLHEQFGRPPGSTSINYADMDPLIDFQHANPGRLSQKFLIDLIRHVYEQKDQKVPSVSMIKARITRLKPKPK